MAAGTLIHARFAQAFDFGMIDDSASLPGKKSHENRSTSCTPAFTAK
jgi:hypothetical protein